jgi:peptide/nickel transport system substrate-binding protein
LNDPVVRLAIEYAIDRQMVVDVAYGGYAQPGTTMIAPILGEWHNDEIDAIPFDIDQANRILDAAGYVDSDGDGVREYSDGSRLGYRLMAAPTDAPVMETISNGLRDVGIFAIVELTEYDSQSALVYEFDFDLNYWVWNMDIDPDFGMVVFLCAQREEWGWNDSGYCDEEFEEMYLQQLHAVDQAARRDLIWQMQEKIYQERPWIVLCYPQTIQAYRSDRFTGFREEAGAILSPWSIMHVEPAQ